MRHFHKHSSFPLVLTLLSLGLVVFMFYAFTFEGDPVTESNKIVEEEVVTIDADQYRNDLSFIIRDFSDEIGLAEDDLARLLVTESTLEQLLDLRVPTEYKDLHLNLAVIIHQLESGLRSTDRSTTEPLLALDALLAEYPWITE